MPVKQFLQKLLVDICRIEATTYIVSCKGETLNVKFLISELPNDMKMPSFLGSEPTNSAKYFSSFGDVKGWKRMAFMPPTLGSHGSIMIGFLL